MKQFLSISKYQKILYKGMFILILVLFTFSVSFTQTFYWPSCGMPDTDEPLGDERSNCELDADNMIQNHKAEIIPLIGHPIVLPVNFVIVQDLNGNNNFDLNNQDHMTFLNNVISKMNSRMINLADEACDCSENPTFIENSKIMYDVNIVAMRSPIWNSSIEDPKPILDLSCPLDPNHYISRLNAEFLQSNVFSEAITFFFTHGGNGTAQYNGRWYSGTRCDFDPSHPALIHATNSYDSYKFIVDGLAPPDKTIEGLENFNARTAAHEIYHQFQIGVGHRHFCQFNLMNGSSSKGPAPDPDNPTTAITGCQLRQGYGTMMAHHLSKYVPCIESFEQEIEISSDEIWDTETKVFSNIKIINGASLTIKCQIEMQNNAKVLVKKGGTLIVDGGELKSCGEWQGIVVEGDRASESQANAGKVFLRNNVIIENARTAISMNPSHIQWPQLQDHWGGLVQAENSTFRNCHRAVEFMKYGMLFTNDESYFINCNFENLSHSAITIWEDNGVLFEGCTFNNIEKSGIYTIDSKIEVYEGCTFNDINTGIYSIHTKESTKSSIIGKSLTTPNEFLCDNYGIYVISVGNAEPLQITNNNFFGGTFGVHIDGISTFDISHNDFIGQYVAIDPAATGSTGTNYIRNNNVSSSNYGSHAAYNNYNLKYDDNCFGFNSFADVYVNNGSIFIDQGDENFANGNCFTKGGVPEIDNSVNSTQIQLWVYKNEPITSCELPTLVDSDPDYNVKVTKQSLNDPTDNCGSNFTGELVNIRTFCKGPFKTKQELLNKIAEIEGIIADVESNSSYSEWYKQYLLRLYQRCLKKLRLEVIIIILEPVEGGDNIMRSQQIEEAITYSNSLVDFEHRLFAYGLMVESNQLNRARLFLNNLSTQSQEQADYIIAQNIYLDFLNDRHNYELSSQDENLLITIGNKSNPLDGYSRSIYEVITGSRIELNIPSPHNSTRPRSTSNRKFPIEVSIYPNPVTNGEVNIEINSEDEEKFFINIFDVYGNLVNSHILTRGMHDINTQTWTSGMYLVEVKSQIANTVSISKLLILD